MKQLSRAALALNLRALLLVSLLMGAVSGVQAEDYKLYSGELTAGDYLVVYNTKAMKAVISNNRLSYSEVTITDDVISNPDANLIWTISANDKYFTLYNSSVAKYAASTGVANKAKLEASVTNNSRWTVTGSSTYEFVNLANDKAEVNKNLRNNGTYGFACYATSTGGALSLYKLVEAGENDSEEPTITGDANPFFSSKTVTITAAEGAAIYYTLDGSNPTTSSTKYTQPFEITNTTTVKAIAVENGKNASSIASETFEKDIIYTLGELTTQAAGSYYVNFQNAVVTYVDGSYCYIEDATGAILYFSASNGRKVGDTTNGVAQVTYTVYQSLPEITAINGATFTEGTAPSPVVVTLADLTANFTSYLSKFIKVEGVTVTSALDNKSATIEQNGTSIALRQNGDKTIEHLTKGAILNLTTFPTMHGTTQQLVVYSDDLIEVLSVKADPELAFAAASYTANLGESFTAPTLTNPHNLVVTYSSSAPDVASVDEATGAVTIKAAGDVVITATFAGNDDYWSDAVSYKLLVEDPNVIYYALVAEYNGNYFAVRNSISSNAFASTQVDVVNGKVITPMTDNIAWIIESSGSNAYLINKAKGSDGYNQYITFTEGGTSLSKTNSRSENNKWSVDATNKSWLNSDNKRSIIYSSENSNFKNYAVGNIGKSGYATSYTQAYTFASGYTRTVTAGAWGTICLPNDVAADDYAGVKFYSIAGKDKAENPTSITLQEVSELEAGVPYLFQANEDATKLVAAYGKQSVATAGSNNGLTGSLEGQEVDEGMYLLSGGKIVLCGTGCSIGANRAYIDMSQVPVVSAGVKGVTFFFNGQVGVNGLEADSQNNAPVFDLTGRRVSKTQHGLYIVNGKKVIVK